MSEMRFKMQTWIRKNGAVVDRLEQAMVFHALEAGWEGDNPNHDQQQALHDAGVQLFAAVHDAKRIPPPPDPAAAEHFAAGLDYYEQAARAFSADGFGTDAADVAGAAKVYESGLREIQSCAVAIRRATGQE